MASSSASATSCAAKKFNRAYLGISGGIDSAVASALAVAALGKHNVIGVTMPSHVTTDETKSDAHLLAKNLEILCHERPISPEYVAWLGEFKRFNGKEPSPITKQNKQSRIRGAILMEYSNEDHKGIVLTTGNKTEIATGYCTMYGDMCGALAVLGDVSKERVYALARYINGKAGKEIVPQSVIDRVPTAELEVGQEDRKNLPADYPVLSPVVEEIVESGESVEELVKKFPRDVVEKVNRLVQVSEFKRRQAAPGIRVTRRAFGIGRRVPMGHGYYK